MLGGKVSIRILIPCPAATDIRKPSRYDEEDGLFADFSDA
jgi:hypothetical protein